MEIETSYLECEMASVASAGALSHELLLGGTYPYWGDDDETWEMDDEMPPSNCKGTGTHVTHVSNNALRIKYKVATIGSILARRRQLFWKKLPRPWFVETDDTTLSSHASLGLLGAIFD